MLTCYLQKKLRRDQDLRVASLRQLLRRRRVVLRATSLGLTDAPGADSYETI